MDKKISSADLVHKLTDPQLVNAFIVATTEDIQDEQFINELKAELDKRKIDPLANLDDKKKS